MQRADGGSVMFLPERHMCCWLAAIFNPVCDHPPDSPFGEKLHSLSPPPSGNNPSGVLDVTHMKMSGEGFCEFTMASKKKGGGV